METKTQKLETPLGNSYWANDRAYQLNSFKKD